MEELIERIKPEEEVNMLSPLTWAYVGDCVYELYIRTKPMVILLLYFILKVVI